MNRLARLMDLSSALDRDGGPAVLNVPRPRGAAAGHYQLLVDRLRESHNEHSSGIITAFTSIRPREGVTHVVETLAWELAAESTEHVLLSTARSLAYAARAGASELSVSSQERVHRIADLGNNPLPRGRKDGLLELRERFGFILVDCPSLSLGPGIQRTFELADHAVLVVLAGQATHQDVTWAQEALAAASANVIGLVLNRTRNAR